MDNLKNVLFFLLAFIYSHQAFTQDYSSRWQYTWGGGREEVLSIMIPLPDNKYFFAGGSASSPQCTKSSTGYGDKDFAAFVLDGNGNKIWEKSYGGEGPEYGRSAVKIKSGGFIIVGDTYSRASGLKSTNNIGIWMIKIDDNGQLLWEKTFGGNGSEWPKKIIETADGGFLIAGTTYSNDLVNNHGRSDFFLIKTDASGNRQWSKSYGGTEFEDLYDFIETNDGNFFLSGETQSPNNGNKTSPSLGSRDIWLVKINPDGNIIWDRSYGTPQMDLTGTLLPLADGNTIIVESGLSEGRIRKIDPNGHQLWVRSCAGNNSGDKFEVAAEDIQTGKIYVAGLSSTNSSGCKTSPFYGRGMSQDIWIAIFDTEGNKIDDWDFGGDDSDIPTDIDIVDGDIWITSWSNSSISGNKTSPRCAQSADGWIIRLSKRFYVNNKTIKSTCQTSPDFKVHFTTTYDFQPGNIFTVQLSDKNGNFHQPIHIGSVLSTRSDSTMVTLPHSIAIDSAYKLRIISSMPADTTSTYSFTVSGIPVINLGNDTTICDGSSIRLNAGLQPTNTEFKWQDNSTANSYILKEAGIYWCEVQNGCGISRDSLSVEIKFKPIANIGTDVSFCEGETVEIKSMAQHQDANYQWNTGAVSQHITIKDGGLYWMRASNSCGSTIDSLIATLNQLPKSSLKKDSVICDGSTHILSPGAGFTDYLWNTGEKTPSIIIHSVGRYWVKITDQNRCENMDSVSIVKVAEAPTNFLPKDTLICSYEKLIINPQQSYLNYRWNNGSTSKTITITQPQTYWLEVKDKYGCLGKDSIHVGLKNCINGIFFPSAFTPNNDGKNDLLHPLVYGNIINFHFVIYNRWGEMVFESSDPKKGWNGTYKSKLSENGAYIWTCRYQFQGEKTLTKKGTALLIK
jgi:gliding motility-associated-like protein